jgi:hypothetical protein
VQINKKIIFLIFLCFLGLTLGFGANKTYSEQSIIPLPINQGGTGSKTHTSNQILTTDINGNLSSRPITDTIIENSTDFITSGSVYTATTPQILNNDDVFTINSEYFDFQASTPVKVKRLKNFMSISGPFLVKKEIPVARNGTTVFTLKAGYLANNYIGVSCSNNFFGTWGTARLDCEHKAGAVRIQTNEIIPISGPDSSGLGSISRFIDFNFTYLIG